MPARLSPHQLQAPRSQRIAARALRACQVLARCHPRIGRTLLFPVLAVSPTGAGIPSRNPSLGLALDPKSLIRVSVSVNCFAKLFDVAPDLFLNRTHDAPLNRK